MIGSDRLQTKATSALNETLPGRLSKGDNLSLVRLSRRFIEQGSLPAPHTSTYPWSRQKRHLAQHGPGDSKLPAWNGNVGAGKEFHAH